MRLTSTLLFFLISFFNFAQIPQGHGTFKKVRWAGIKSIASIHVNYNDSTPADTMFLEKVLFNKNGQLIRREFPKRDRRWNCHIDYHYNFRGYLTRMDSSGLFGSGYGSMGKDTLYSQVEEIWEKYDTTSRLFRRKVSTDNWLNYSETQFIYDTLGRLIEEKKVHVYSNLSEVHTSCKKYYYTDHSFLREEKWYFEDRLTAEHLHVYEYF